MVTEGLELIPAVTCIQYVTVCMYHYGKSHHLSIFKQCNSENSHNKYITLQGSHTAQFRCVLRLYCVCVCVWAINAYLNLDLLGLLDLLDLLDVGRQKFKVT